MRLLYHREYAHVGRYANSYVDLWLYGYRIFSEKAISVWTNWQIMLLRTDVVIDGGILFLDSLVMMFLGIEVSC